MYRSYATPLAILIASISLSVSSPITVDLYVVEESPNNTVVAELHSKVPSTFFNNGIFRILGKSNLFYIETQSWKLRTKSRIDRENICSNGDSMDQCILSLVIIYQTNKMSTKPSLIRATVHVLDINDHAPTWNRQENRMDIKIPEHTPVNTMYHLPEAIDLDCGPDNVTKHYYIAKTSKSHMFFDIKVNKKSRDSVKSGAIEIRLVILSDLDREKQSYHEITVVAIDGGTPPLSGELKVTIEMTDINDHPPTFKHQSPVKIEIKEDALINYPVFQFQAVDLDSGDIKNLKFSFARTTTDDIAQTFWLKESDGNLILQRNLDYEIVTEYSFSVQVSDGTFQSTIEVEIKVLNINDNSPKIAIESFVTGGILSVPENLPSGQHVGAVVVSDADDKNGVNQLFCVIRNPIVELSVLDDGAKNTFLLKTTNTFDREERSYYVFSITCSDSGIPVHNSSITTRLHIKDVNDNAPEFLNSPMLAYLNENSPAGAFVYQVRVQDLDLEENANFIFSLLPESQMYFRIDKDTGQIYSKQSFDAEQDTNYEIFVSVNDKQDGSGHKITGSLALTIEDVNDNSPIFEKDVYSFMVIENSKSGTLIGQVKSKDVDLSERFNVIRYSFKHPTDHVILKHLSVAHHGKIYIKSTYLDREEVSSFAFYVMASDNGSPSLSTSAYVQIEVKDVNDNAPEWVYPDSTTTNINITFRIPVGHEVTKFHAKDPDQGKNSELEYFITQMAYGNGIFQLQPSTGVLYIARTLMPQDIRTYVMVIGVRDHGQPPLSKLSKYTINIVHHVDEARGSFALFGKIEGDLLIILILVVVTLLICLGLISAIWCLKCGNRGPLWCKAKVFNPRESLRPPDGHSPTPSRELVPIFLSRRHDSFISNDTKTTYADKNKTNDSIKNMTQSLNNKNDNYYQCLNQLNDTDRELYSHHNSTSSRSPHWYTTSLTSSNVADDPTKAMSKSQTLVRDNTLSVTQNSVKWSDKKPSLADNDDEYQICISNRSTPKFPIIKTSRSSNLKELLEFQEATNSDYTQLSLATSFRCTDKDSDLPMSYV